MYHNCVLLFISQFVLSLVCCTNIIQTNILEDNGAKIDSTKDLKDINVKRDTEDIKTDLGQNDVWDIFINGDTDNHPNLALNAHFQPYSPSQLTWNLINNNLNDVGQRVMPTSDQQWDNGSGKCNTEKESIKGTINDCISVEQGTIFIMMR